MNDISNLVEVFGLRLFPNNERLCFFKCKIFIGENDWLDIDNFKLCRYTDSGEYYVLPPAEKSPKTSKWLNIVWLSDGLKNAIFEKAKALYLSGSVSGSVSEHGNNTAA